jgi:competence protein ComEC
MGYGYLQLAANWQLPTLLPTAYEGRDLVVSGSVIGLPADYSKRQRFQFRVDHWQSSGQTAPITQPLSTMPKTILLSWYQRGQQPIPRIKPGQKWQLSVRLKRPHGFANPGGFDYGRWLIQQGMGATGYVRTSHHNQLLNPAQGQWINRLRDWLRQQVQSSLPGQPLAGVMSALMVADRSQVSNVQYQTLTATGTNHLLAISGLHIGLVAGLIFFLLRRFALYLCFTGTWSYSGRIPVDHMAAIGALLGAWFYAALAGFALPTQRALVMLSVALITSLLARRTSVAQLLALALLAVLILDPLAIASASFWLSFGAVAVLLYGYAGRLGRTSWWHNWGYSQYLVVLGLLPLLGLLFNQFSLTAPLANLIAIPLVGLVCVPIILLAAVLLMSGAESLAQPILQAVDYLLTALWWYLNLLASELPAYPVSLPQGYRFWLAIPLFIVAVIWGLAPKGIPGRWLSLVLLLPLFVPYRLLPPTGAVKVTILDVGQGLALVLETHRHTLLYDTGPRYGERLDAGSAVILPYLRQQGIHQIDTLIVSHHDQDHRGGLASLLAAHVPVKKIITGSDKTQLATPTVRCQAGDHWQWDGVQFSFLYGGQDYPSASVKENNKSCVLKVSTAGSTLLIPGDIGSSIEKRLVSRYGNQLKADLLIAPHHGSNSSSSWSFLQQVKPEQVVYSSGYRNPFNHPSPKVVSRYQQLGTKSHTTADSGAISYYLANQLSAPHYYRQPPWSIVDRLLYSAN